MSLFAKQMTNERGLIVLAAIFFANGNPYGTAAVALLFGTATALSVRLPQATGAGVSPAPSIDPLRRDRPRSGRCSASASLTHAAVTACGGSSFDYVIVGPAFARRRQP